MCVREGLAGANDCGQIALHEFYAISAISSVSLQRGHTLIEVALVEVLRARNVHVVQTCYLRVVSGGSSLLARMDAIRSDALYHVSFSMSFPRLNLPRKCWSNLISRNARLARIFFEKTFVTFLIATPSPVWLFVAALCGDHQSNCRSEW